MLAQDCVQWQDSASAVLKLWVLLPENELISKIKQCLQDSVMFMGFILLWCLS